MMYGIGKCFISSFNDTSYDTPFQDEVIDLKELSTSCPTTLQSHCDTAEHATEAATVENNAALDEYDDFIEEVYQENDYVSNLRSSVDGQLDEEDDSKSNVASFYSIFLFDRETRKRVSTQFERFKITCAKLVDYTKSSNELGEWLASEESKAIESILQRNYRLILLGQTNSGKSALINEFLGQTCVPVVENPTEIGLIHFKYSHNKNYIGLRKFSQQSSQLNLPHDEVILNIDNSIHEIFTFVSKVRANQTIANHLDALDVHFEVGLRNNFLARGLELVDTPGIKFRCSNYERLAEWVSRSFLQAAIYLIDGNRSINETDRGFLYFLRSTKPNIKVYYLVNKVDYDSESIMMDMESDFEDGDEENNDVIIKKRGELLLNEKRLRVFKNLLSNQLLEDRSESQLSHFGSISVLGLMIERRDKHVGPHLHEFHKVQREFVKLCEKNLNANIRCAVSTLFLVQRRLFDLMLTFEKNRSSSKSETNYDYNKLALDMEKKFSEIYQSCDLECYQFTHKLKEKLELEKIKIVQCARQMNFQPIQIKEYVRKNEIMIQCKEQVRDFVLMKLNEILAKNLTQSVSTFMMHVTSKLNKVHAAQTFSEIGSCLTNDAEIEMLAMQNYVLNSDVLHENLIQRCRIKVKDFLTDSSKMIDLDWKEKMAENYVHQFDYEQVVKNLFDNLKAALKSAENRVQRYMQRKQRLTYYIQRTKIYFEAVPAFLNLYNMIMWDSCKCEALNTMVTNGVIPVGKEKTKLFFHLAGTFGSFEPDQNVVIIKKISSENENWNISRAAYYLAHRLLKNPSQNLMLPEALGYDKQFNFCIIISHFETNLLSELEKDEVPEWSIKQAYNLVHQISKACLYLSNTNSYLLADLRPNNILLNYHGKQNIRARLLMPEPPDCDRNYPDVNNTPAFHYHHQVFEDNIPFNNREPQLSWQLLILLWLVLMKSLCKPIWRNNIEYMPVKPSDVHSYMKTHGRDEQMIHGTEQLANWFTHKEFTIEEIFKHTNPNSDIEIF